MTKEMVSDEVCNQGQTGEDRDSRISCKVEPADTENLRMAMHVKILQFLGVTYLKSSCLAFAQYM